MPMRRASESDERGVPAGASAVVLNIAAAGTAPNGFLKLWPRARRSGMRPRELGDRAHRDQRGGREARYRMRVVVFH